ncbi:hypothetical protein Tco_1056333 [Tanacetum coccineum]|uniref:Uncharacterized protein n=1 Tax=Tanacetum coccineum TaxID=301880 RepID=A0ABQ5H2D9_9ASTR
MSCSNPPPNFSRKPRISVRQVWRRTTLTPKSPPSSQNASPSLPPRVNPQSPSSSSHNPLRDQMINQLHNISSILESQTQNPPNAYSRAPPLPPSPLIRPPTNAQVESHSSFCHCCSVHSSDPNPILTSVGLRLDVYYFKTPKLDYSNQ